MEEGPPERVVTFDVYGARKPGTLNIEIDAE
jgi:hypothetical protein